MTQTLDALIVGGGISGLTTAYTLQKHQPSLQFKILESANRVGGWIQTISEHDCLVERGPESFITDKPWALELAEELGLQNELIQTRKQPFGAYILRGQKLHPIPAGFSLLAPTQWWPFLKSPILSPKAKLRALLEPFIPSTNQMTDESLADFTTRRFGKEFLDAFAQPLASGIYGADPKKLSMKAALPRFWEAEQNHRSLIRGLRYNQKTKKADEKAGGARYGLFMSFKKGMQSLVHALEQKLQRNIELNQNITQIQFKDSSWHVHSNDQTWIAKSLILAISAKTAKKLLKNSSPKLSNMLDTIPFGSSATVTFSFQQNALEKPLNAYGFVVPAIENRKIMACTFSSEKWEGRTNNNSILLRVFISDTGTVQAKDEVLEKTALTEIQHILNIDQKPMHTWIDRFNHAMPQYHVGHVERVEQIDKECEHLTNFYLIGNSYKGVGLPDSIRLAKQAAANILSEYQQNT